MFLFTQSKLYEMADGKKSFVLYCDLMHTFDLLDDATAGKLMKHLLHYVNDLNPETDDLMIKIAFEPIKHQLKRDLRDWEIIKKDRSIAGRLGNLKRWNLDLYDNVVSEKMGILEAEEIAKNRIAIKKSHPVANIAVTVTDTVNVTDTVTNILPQKNKNGKENGYSGNFKARGEEVMGKRLAEGIEAANKSRVPDSESKE